MLMLRNRFRWLLFSYMTKLIVAIVMMFRQLYSSTVCFADKRGIKFLEEL